MRKFFFLLSTIFLSSPLFANAVDRENSKRLQLEKCLLEEYQIDLIAIPQILEKFSPLLENDAYTSVIDAFLCESKKLNIYSGFPDRSESFASSYHSVLFENSHLRVSWAVTQSGEQEPFQRHPWKTLMIVIRPSQFHSQREDGSSYQDNWPIGSYLLDSSAELLSCKNIGSTEYNGLVFEIKTVEHCD